MVKCEYCGYDPGTSYSQCSLCGGTFCRLHKLPPDHQCVKIDNWKNEDGKRKAQSTSYSPSDNWKSKFHKNVIDKFAPRFYKTKKAALLLGVIGAFALGIGLIILGVFLYVGNRSGTFTTFAYAGFITMSFGFFIIAVLLNAWTSYKD